METNELINQMIDKIIDGDNVEAQTDFEALLAQKMDVALDARKQELAQSVYSTETQPEEENTVEDEEPADADNTAI